MDELRQVDTVNPLTYGQMVDYANIIFKAATIYYKFEENFKKINESEQNNKEEKIYMISKEFLDNFKTKIDYYKIRDTFAKEENEENKKNFEEQLLKKYNLDELELIIFGEINLYGDFEKIEENYKKGFEFVNYEFLDQLEFEFDANMKESNIDYYKENNNIIIIFWDKSKLIISEKDGEKKYYAIPSPVTEIKDSKKYKKTKTFSMSNKNRIKTRKG